MTTKSTIWENTDGCADKYRCATALYLVSMLSHAYKTLFDSGVGSPGHGKYVVDGMNATEKNITMLMTTVRLPGASTNDSHMVLHTVMSNIYISISRVFQKHLSYPTRAHGLIDHVKCRKQNSTHKWT